MIRDYSDYLKDIFSAIDSILRFTKGMAYSDFEADEKTQFAVIRAFEIIGEAAGKIPADVRARNSGIPWLSIITMRNKLIHEYFGVNLAVVWETIQTDIPDLRDKMKRIGI